MTRPPALRRPVLAPGLRPLRHPSGQVQFGLGAEHRLRIPDAAGVRRALAILDRGEALPNTPDLRAARTLMAPVLRDGNALVRPGVDPGVVAAVALAHPRSATTRLAAREQARVRVLGDLGPDAVALLAAVGLDCSEDGTDTASVTLVLSRGEPERATCDELVRARQPHLVVRAVEGEIVVGPFFIPGASACLQCWDLHQSQADPAYGALLIDALHHVRHDGVAEPVDLAMAWIALGTAVRDLVRFVEGDSPTTAAAVLRLSTRRLPLAAEPLAAHPDCSCTWGGGRDDSFDQ